MNRGWHPWLDATIAEWAHFGRSLGSLGAVPGNGGDISALVPDDAMLALRARLPEGVPVRFDQLERLRAIRGDGRPYYRAQGTALEHLDTPMESLVDRMLLTTTSGAKIWDLERYPARHLCLTTIRDDHFLLHATTSQTSVPTTELLNHLIGHARNAGAGLRVSTVLHVHPQRTIDLSRHAETSTADSFNYYLYTQRIEQLANIPELVGFVPFSLPGSTTLAKATATAFRDHRVVVWQSHGVIVREESIERCVDLVQYTESSARAALQALMIGNLRVPSRAEIAAFLSMYELPDDFLQLLDRREDA